MTSIRLFDQQTGTWWPSGVAAANTAPVARLDGSASGTVGQLVEFNPGGSWDPEGDPLTFTWSLTRPAGSSAVLQAAGTLRRLSPDVAGTYRVRLTVADDGGAARGMGTPVPLVDVAEVAVTVTAPPVPGGVLGEEGMRARFGWMVIADSTMEASHAEFETDIGRKVLYTSVNFGHSDRVPPMNSAWNYEVDKFIKDWGPRVRGANPVVLCAIIHIFGAASRPAPAQWQQELRNVANGVYDAAWIEQIDKLTAAGFRNYLVPRLGHEGDLKANMSSKIGFITNPSSLAHMQEMENLYRRALEHVMRLWSSRGYRVSYPGNGGWFQELQGATWLGSTLHSSYVGMKLWEFAQPDPALYYDFGCDIYLNSGRMLPEFMAMVRELVDTATTLGKPWSIPEWGVWVETGYTAAQVIDGVNGFLDLVASTPAMGDPANPAPGSCHYYNYFWAGVRQNIPGRTNLAIHYPSAYEALFVDRLGGTEVSLPGDGEPAPEPEPVTPTDTFDVIVTTDLGGDPDDIQSLVHLVQNTDVLKVKGIISTMGVSAAGDPAQINLWIRRADPTALRARGFGVMREADLLATVKTGSRSRGAPTAGRATAGSAHIIATANNGTYSQTNPLWVLVWGAITDVAQALFTAPSIRDKIRVYSIGDYNTDPGDPASRSWMLNFLDSNRTLWWLENGVLPRESRSTFRGVWRGGNQSGEWHPKTFLETNIRGHGTIRADLGETQRVGDLLPAGNSPAGSVAVGGLKEGDSPSMLYLLSPIVGGVGNVDNPAAESWGGRFRRPQSIYPNYWVDLNLTPEGCQETINKWRAPTSGGFLRHWKSRWDRYAAPLVTTTTTGVLASEADKFVDSIAVNTHWHYTDRIYHTQYAAVRDLLVASGIRNYRDYSMPSKQAVYVELAGLGLKMSAVQSVRQPDGVWRPASTVTLAQTLDVADAVYNAGGLGAVEAANELDISSSFGPDPQWATYARQHLADVLAGMGTRGIPADRLIGPAVTWDYNTAELGDIRAWTPVANMHPYTGGYAPETARPVADRDAALANNVPGGKVHFTEAGYHNQVPSDTGHRGIPEAEAAIYLPRMFLHYWALGIPRTAAYEFADQGTSGAEMRFGLIRNDLTVKPGYTAVKNLIDLLADPGPSFTPTRLDYSTAGGNSATRTVLLQKRDGSFWLAVWQATSVWDPVTRAGVNPGDVNVVLQFGRTVTTVRRYLPNASVAAQSTSTGITGLAVASEERVTLLEIIV